MTRRKKASTSAERNLPYKLVWWCRSLLHSGMHWCCVACCASEIHLRSLHIPQKRPGVTSESTESERQVGKGSATELTGASLTMCRSSPTSTCCPKA